MALLQISEPGMSTAPHQHRLAVGIDLGTTNSLVATVRNSIPEVLNDEDGRALLPSVVRYLPNGHANIGYKAQAAQTTDRRTPSCPSSASWAAAWRISPTRKTCPTISGCARHGAAEDRRRRESPVEVSAQILATLRQRAEDSLGDDLVAPSSPCRPTSTTPSARPPRMRPNWPA
jgi:molecular chaperone HscA